MALQASGAITMTQIQAEFGGATPISLSEYYGAATGVPASGAISMSQFYGKSAYHTTSIVKLIPRSKTTGVYTNTSWASTWTTSWISKSGCQGTDVSRTTSVAASRSTATSWTTSWSSTFTTYWLTYWK